VEWRRVALGSFLALFPAPGDWRHDPDRPGDPEAARLWYSAANWARRRRAAELGRVLGASAHQVALAWVLHQPFPTAVVIGPSSLAHARDSYAALGIELTPEPLTWHFEA
jgi:aryl-alcohol dehydrogenase-like predicted oxidoreductase